MTETPQPPAEAAPAPPAEAPQSNGMATAGMILGIVALALMWMWCLPFIPIIIGVVGLILSILGMKKAKQLNGAGAGKAKVGLICSILGIAVPVVIWIIVLSVAAPVTGKALDDFQKAMEQYSNQPAP